METILTYKKLYRHPGQILFSENHVKTEAVGLHLFKTACPNRRFKT
ncbi:hypothetical protein NEIPOLOT_02080 [Neisseria polysaccharea ATCC 43768]|nr:hypothetical protein NEIPOLOT_02080 [Neisseria polysaccharea ATCC 43768]